MSGNTNALFTGLVGVGFLVGSIPVGQLVGALRGTDLRSQGSGNIGFANALRVLGWRWAVLVLAGDLAKGYLPVFVTRTVALPLIPWVAFATVIGSVFSPWLGWRGGKGVAALLGACLALDPRVGLVAGVIYAVVVPTVRISSLGSLMATTTLTLIGLWLRPELGWFWLASLFLIGFTHRANIGRLIQGTEAKFDRFRRGQS